MRVCDVSPKNVILQADSPMQLGEGLSLVTVLPPKGGANLHLKWHIVVSLGDKARPDEERRHP